MMNVWHTFIEFTRGIGIDTHILCISDFGGLLLGAFGIYMALRSKRTSKFKFKIAAVFLLPIICSLGSIHPSLQPTEFHIRAYMSTFVILLTLLYWREIGHLSDRIREHKEAFAGLLNAVPDMVWMKDPNGTYTFGKNEVTDSLILCDPKEILGKTDGIISREHRKRGMEFLIPDIFESKNWVNDQGEIVHAPDNTGDNIILRVFRVPIHIIEKDSGKRKLWGVVGIGQNMTDYIEQDSPEITRKLKNNKIGPK